MDWFLITLWALSSIIVAVMYYQVGVDVGIERGWAQGYRARKEVEKDQ